MTLNEMFEIEKNESIIRNGKHPVSLEEKERIQKQYEAVNGARTAFCRNIVEMIPSEKDAEVVSSSISDSASVVEAVLKIRRMIHTGIAACSDRPHTELDNDTVDVLKKSINDFNCDTSLLAVGSNK